MAIPSTTPERVVILPCVLFPSMLHYFGYFAAIFIGLSLGIMGGGGSILTVPVLVYLIGMNPVLSTAYSLFIVGSTSLVGAVSYARKGLVSVPTALVFLATSLGAVFLTRSCSCPPFRTRCLRRDTWSLPRICWCWWPSRY